MNALEDFYYPGSKTPRKTVPEAPEEEEQEPGLFEEAVELLGEPLVFSVGGKDVEFFLIGQLAAALGRSATTLRRWESDGTIPKSGYAKSAKDPRGRRRLYTRGQCEGIIQIAIDEGVMLTGRIKGTQFPARVASKFKELKGIK